MTFASSPDLDAFLREQADEIPVINTTGVYARSANVGWNDQADGDLIRWLMERDLKSQRIDNCREHEPTVIFPLQEPFPFAGMMRFYSCDNGYQVVDTIAVDHARTARAMIVRLVGTRAEMQYLIHIPDSVQRLDGP